MKLLIVFDIDFQAVYKYNAMVQNVEYSKNGGISNEKRCSSLTFKGLGYLPMVLFL